MFLMLFLCFCVDYCVAAAEEGGNILLNGEEYIRVQGPESVAWGFGYARKDGTKFSEILPDIKKAREDVLCSTVYQGQSVDFLDYFYGRTSPTVHFSVMHENRISKHAALAFLREYRLEGAFMCVCLEDLADFCVFLDRDVCGGKIKIGLPREHPCQEHCQSEYGFGACFERYREETGVTKDKPVVFFSSGRRGFAGAGEFLFQLGARGGLWPHNNVNFFFTALKEEEYLDAREEIVRAAVHAAVRAGCQDDWLCAAEIFDGCVKHVGCQETYKGRTVFVQDECNILAPCWLAAGVLKNLQDQEGPWDVLVGWASEMDDDMMAPYLAQAHKLFKLLSETLEAGCITGAENPEDVPDRSKHTLVCVGGSHFAFGETLGCWIQDKFHYKSLEVLGCDLTDVNMHGTRSLVVGGNLVERSVEEASCFNVLFLSPKLSRYSLDGYEDGIVLNDGRLYARVRDRESVKEGFAYACEKRGHAKGLLKDFARVRKDFACEAVYCGMCETKSLSELGPIKYLSLWHEKTLSEHAVDLFFKENALPESFVCICYEDLADFCNIGQFLQSGAVHVSKPKRSPLSNDPRFEECLDQYTQGKPIVFCASGRSGFVAAGEFLYALFCRKDISAKNPSIHFLFTTISLPEMQGYSARNAILRKARHFAACVRGNDDGLMAFGVCVKTVATADAYDGHVVFAQDNTNFLVGVNPDTDSLRDYKYHDDYDVLVDWLPDHGRDSTSVAYWQGAWLMFEEMRCYGAACITDEDCADGTKASRTLLCIDGAEFDGAKDFGHRVARKLGYKDAVFVPCGGRCISLDKKLVAMGVVEHPCRPDMLKTWRYTC